MLGAFHREHPQVELDLAEHNSAVLLDLLGKRTVDVACMNIPASGWDAHSSLSWILDQAFARRGLDYVVRYHITDQHSLLELSAEGLGVGVSTRVGIARRPVLSLHAVGAADAELSGVGVAAWTERAYATAPSRPW
jgi:DNA-binding transcriptional LysR family regulator